MRDHLHAFLKLSIKIIVIIVVFLRGHWRHQHEQVLEQQLGAVLDLLDVPAFRKQIGRAERLCP